MEKEERYKKLLEECLELSGKEALEKLRSFRKGLSEKDQAHFKKWIIDGAECNELLVKVAKKIYGFLP